MTPSNCCLLVWFMSLVSSPPPQWIGLICAMHRIVWKQQCDSIKDIAITTLPSLRSLTMGEASCHVRKGHSSLAERFMCWGIETSCQLALSSQARVRGYLGSRTPAQGKPSDDHGPGQHLDGNLMRQNHPAKLLLGSWPTEIMQDNKCWLFKASSFGIVHYILLGK